MSPGRRRSHDTWRGPGGAGGGWFLGFVGALIYYLHTHSGSLWLVLVAIVKALFWPAFLVFKLLGLH